MLWHAGLSLTLTQTRTQTQTQTLTLTLALALTLTKVSGAEEAERALHAQLTASHELAAQRAAALQAADQPYPYPYP